MTETHAQAVERLKKNTKPYGLLSEDDRKFLLEIGPTNLQIFSYVRIWQEIPTKSYSAGTFNESLTYRIRPDYQPEPPNPEYIDFPVFIESKNKELRVETPNGVGYGIDYVVRFPDFRGFRSNTIDIPEHFNTRTPLDAVSERMAKGHKVIARFRR